MSVKKSKGNDKNHKLDFSAQGYLSSGFSSDDYQNAATKRNKINDKSDFKLAKKIKIEGNDSETNDSTGFNINKKNIEEEPINDEKGTEVQKIKKKKKKNISDENKVFNNIKQEPIAEDQCEEPYAKKEKKKKKKKDIERVEDSNADMINQKELKLETVDPNTNNDKVENKKNQKKKSRENNIEINNLRSEECNNVSIVESYEPSKKKKRKRQEESTKKDFTQEQNLQEEMDYKVKKKKKKRNREIDYPEDSEMVKEQTDDFILANMSIKIESDSLKDFTDLTKSEKKKKKKLKKLSEQETADDQRNEDIDFLSDEIKLERQEPTEHVDKTKKKKTKLESESPVNSLKENSEKSSTKKKKLSSASNEPVIEEKVEELKSSKKTKVKTEKYVESDSDNEINSYNSSSSEESLIEETPKNNTILKKIEEQRTREKQNITDSELSDEEDDEDFDEEETQPRKRRHKSIFEQQPKIAKILTQSDDEQDELQFQQLNIRQSKQLADLEVKLIHHVLPQHNVEKHAGTRPLTKEEKERFQKYAPLKLGVFTPDEDSRIVHNWKKFCKVHDWKRSLVHPFIFRKRKGFYFISKVEERRKFVQFLAHGLPNRSLYSIFGRFKNLYGTHKQSRYTKEEDNIILKTINDPTVKHPQVVLAKRLNRTRQSVWRRIQKLVKKSESD